MIAISYERMLNRVSRRVWNAPNPRIASGRAPCFSGAGPWPQTPCAMRSRCPSGRFSTA